MELVLTDAALSDLRSIREYTLKTWGEEQEDRYLNEMWARFEQILDDPDRWRFREDLFPRCQIAAQGRHVILFRVEEPALQVVRILHSAMDFNRQIPDDL
ncbi:MAG: type II toxin-antitoxin system RelE/ParE family toxin [Verrucomicrobiales bacterium]|nr:type II toxin-antitoxin system RelE/ParE family toxin [Verrucomicrobiales bacterium]